MKTSVAHTWKSLASKLHPPLSMSPRESQRLLSLLNASFKQQLDREHSADSSSNEHYANLHLQSILTDPLFDAKPRMRASLSNERQSNGKRLEQLQIHKKRPMDAFKERVSQGIADLETANFFLRTQYQDCLASPAATPREAMQSSRVASTILQWLWSSGMEDSGKFLKDQEFVTRLVPFLVVEGQHSHILRWLHLCTKPEQTPFSSLHGLDTNRIQAFLFAKLIKEETRIGGGLESAITLFCRTVADLRSSGCTMSAMQTGAIQAAWILTKAILRLPNAAESEPRIVRPFLATMKNVHVDPQLSATICVFFQKRPDPQPALTYFQNTFTMAKAYPRVERRLHLVHLGLRAADLFLQDSRQTEALWIMDFLQTNFPQELGSPMSQNRKVFVADDPEKMSRREEKSLHLLDTLAVQ